MNARQRQALMKRLNDSSLAEEWAKRNQAMERWAVMPRNEERGKKERRRGIKTKNPAGCPAGSEDYKSRLFPAAEQEQRSATQGSQGQRAGFGNRTNC